MWCCMWCAVVLLSVARAHARDQPDLCRVRPPSGSNFRPMWCAPSFKLNAAVGPECRREDVDGVTGAFMLHGVLTRDEAEQMIELAERMGFEQGEGSVAGRTSAAASWCFHDELAEQIIRRVASLLPWGVAVHSPGTSAPTASQLPQVNGVLPWVRCVAGVPEGLYTLDALNCRTRVYRYACDSSDRFLPHYDEVWPGSRLQRNDDGEWLLEQDRWKYSSGGTDADPNGDRWSWASGERVSHLTVLLYLNDDFQGGATVLYPGSHAGGEAPLDGALQVAVTPRAGAMLCFGQSFKFGRTNIEHSADAILHEGLPVEPHPPDASASTAASVRPRAIKYVLRSDVCYTLPRRRG